MVFKCDAVHKRRCLIQSCCMCFLPSRLCGRDKSYMGSEFSSTFLGKELHTLA
jgi:hypothetical protein